MPDKTTEMYLKSGLKPIIHFFGEPKFHYEYSVFKFVEDLHMFCTGAAEGEEPVLLYFMYEYLKGKVKHWNPSTRKFDNLVKELIEVTIKEYKECRWAPTKQEIVTRLNENRNLYQEQIYEARER